MGLFDRIKKRKEEQEELESKLKEENSSDESEKDKNQEENEDAVKEESKEESLKVAEVKELVEEEKEEPKEKEQEAVKEDQKQEVAKEKKKAPAKAKASQPKKDAKKKATDDDDDDEDDNEEENDAEVDLKAMYSEKMLHKLKTASDRVDKYYSDFRNLILSYEKIKFKSNNACDVYLFNNKPIIKINVFQRSLKVQYALNPKDFSVNKYHHKDVKDTKKYEMVPLQLKVSSDRAYKYAVELLEILLGKYKVNKKAKPKMVDYTIEADATSKELLCLQGLGELLRVTCQEEDSEDLSDSQAKHSMVLETLKTELPGLSERVVAEVTIGELTAAFKSSYVIDLKLLQDTEIVDKNTNYLKVIPGGRCTRAITVKANDFDLTVVKMIVLTGGNVIKLIP